MRTTGAAVAGVLAGLWMLACTAPPDATDGAWQIDGLPFRYDPVPDRSVPIVRKSDPWQVTHYLKAGSVTLGFSANGGGYCNYVDLGDGRNINSAMYGRGWQSAFRDGFHSGRYNPTQAGFLRDSGTPISLIQSENRVLIKQFNVPLWGEAVFDFTQHENLVPDSSRYADQGGRDTDGLDESELNQDFEIRSEFDFSGVYEDYSDRSDTGIPIFRHAYYYVYARAPSAIRQFGRSARQLSGQEVIKEPKRWVISVLHSEEEATDARDHDLSQVILTPYAIRILTHRTGMRKVLWRSAGEWRIGPKLVNDVRPSFKCRLVPDRLIELPPGRKLRSALQPLPDCLADGGLVVLADNDDPFRRQAIGLFYPLEAGTNSRQAIGVDLDSGLVAYREDRLLQSYFFANFRADTQILLGLRAVLTGLRAPNFGNQPIAEGLLQEVYILFGTPGEILDAVADLRGGLSR